MQTAFLLLFSLGLIYALQRLLGYWRAIASIQFAVYKLFWLQVLDDCRSLGIIQVTGHCWHHKEYFLMCCLRSRASLQDATIRS